MGAQVEKLRGLVKCHLGEVFRAGLMRPASGRGCPTLDVGMPTVDSFVRRRQVPV